MHHKRKSSIDIKCIEINRIPLQQASLLLKKKKKKNCFGTPEITWSWRTGKMSTNWLVRSKDIPLIIHFTNLSAYCNASLSELGHLLFRGRSNLHVTQLYTRDTHLQAPHRWLLTATPAHSVMFHVSLKLSHLDKGPTCISCQWYVILLPCSCTCSVETQLWLCPKGQLSLSWSWAFVKQPGGAHYTVNTILP